jgi:hypothetical protein
MIRQFAVDFNRVVEGDLIRSNSRRAGVGTDLAVGSVIVVGDDWGIVEAEVVEHDAESGSLVLRLLGELVSERPGDELSKPACSRPSRLDTDRSIRGMPRHVSPTAASTAVAFAVVDVDVLSLLGTQQKPNLIRIRDTRRRATSLHPRQRRGSNAR